ncbi:MAG: AAA family ATPase, partial [Acidimicrobiales bacterium]
MTTTIRSALGVAVGAGVPVLLWGGPGLGKSSAVREMAEAASLPCETVIASIREPSDFAGLPIVNDDAASVRFAPPAWAERLAGVERGVLFLDEISTAPPAVQAALLRVVLERVVGDLALPAGVTVIAAANPPDQAADGWDLSAPLANRFCHLEWALDPSEWASGVLGGFVPAPIPTFGEDDLHRRMTTHRGNVVAFVSSRPAMFNAPPTDESSLGRAWPSPRSWEMASRLLAAADLAEVGATVAAMLIAGAVGPGPAAEFLAWRQELDLPDPEEVLRDPSSFRLPERGDRAYAALTSVTAAVLADNTATRWQAGWLAVAAGTADGHADIA